MPSGSTGFHAYTNCMLRPRQKHQPHHPAERLLRRRNGRRERSRTRPNTPSFVTSQRMTVS
ncbi:hypothetical protein PAXRUDRAFT_333633 [Paxillus rubicundulus Ve08.2h10]|uniref:Uncharacterized protein n=1 Tax=Paxillus rubicundulus Ve08.2h10 TaxID=930991 RepID=A0A0D0E4I5_9AGAM|nr:hypothetical protein PAXRUDRAFT_333633 [Paxillus rubicundulus Ve08.2h10]